MSDKVLEVQQQVRQNSDELQSFLRDLGSWQKEMEAKDQQLKTASKDGAASTVAKVESKKAMNKSKNANSEKKIPKKRPDSGSGDANVKKIKSHDYSAWDKFDVDKALAELSQSESEEEEDSEEESMMLMQRAMVEKDKGNDFFKKGDFASAIDCYTRGMQCDPSNAVLPANRAMALIKTGQLAAAEADCSLAISLDPSYVKAFHRRASARIALKRIPEAIQDLEKVLQLEPSNKAAATEVGKLKQSLSKEHAEPKIKLNEGTQAKKMVTPSFEENLKRSMTKTSAKISSKNVDEVYVQPVDKKPHQRSKKPLHRIAIVDVDTEEQERPLLEFDERNSTGKIEIHETDDGKEEIQLLTSSKNTDPRIEILSENSVSQEQVFLSSKGEPHQAKKTLQEKVEEEIRQSLNLKTSGNEISFKKCPKSSIQFLSEWRQLKSAKQKCEYLHLLKKPMVDFASIFKHSMESEILIEIIHILNCEMTSGENLSAYLLGLSRVPRIKTHLMFLSSADRKCLNDLMEKSFTANVSPDSRQRIENVFK